MAKYFDHLKVFKVTPFYDMLAVWWIWLTIGLYNQQQCGSDTQNGVTITPGTFIIFWNFLSGDYRNFNEKSIILKG